MVHYADLSDYEYGRADVPMVNVGWLEGGHAFRQGAVDPFVRDVLARLARSPANLMRGLHYCDFCDAESPIMVTASDDIAEVAYLGLGEIHVAGVGITYAAPTLIVHYIDAHRYLPPGEFVEAVRQLTLSAE